MSHEPFDDDGVVNTSHEPAIADIIEARLSRRAILKGVATAGAFGLFGGTVSGARSVTAGKDYAALAFSEIGRFSDDTHHVAPGYNVQVLIRWGDPIRRGGPQFRPGAQTAEEQEQQFGMNNDYIAYMPLPRGSGSSTRGLLCANHEYTIPRLMWPRASGSGATMTRERVEIEMSAHGLSVLEIARTAGGWRLAGGSPYNRRISARGAVMGVAGPAAGHTRMRTNADPSGVRIIGTFNNCAGGVTPWGTVLSAEENIQFYFSGKGAPGPEEAARRRYGIAGRGFYEAWARHFERFDLGKEPNEPNRFGWIVEVDPYDPKSVPVKRTALGRFKHECATTALSHDGRVAVYSGDDERMEYVYKFVTRGRYDPKNPDANRNLLDEGTLYVAKFLEQGRMRWRPLVFGEGPLTAANGFTSQADVVIEARRAADLLGATPMDRPEDVEAHPVTGRVYVVMTSNARRKPGEVNVANPRAPNRYGHIIEIVPPLVGGIPDHTATECDWGFFLLGGDPANPEHGARYRNPVTANGWLCAPDNVAFDPRGRIWIATDGQDYVAGFADSVYAAETSGPRHGATRCFFAAPRGAEICGPEFTPDGKTLFLAIQHPGDEKGSTYDKPSTRWPDFREGVPPRPSVVAITRADGGEIGN
ncbi:MAG: PhoX family phosphatase [Betaproteobacteria bacterium]|nr:PhoX family phosphatase [Betaproteobacteria bacterium]